MHSKTLIIVGNGPIGYDLSKTIDNADYVVRFNQPNNHSGMSGTKTDQLVFATSSKQAWMSLDNQSFLCSKAVTDAQEILFAIHPLIIKKYHPQPNFLSYFFGKRADATYKAINIFGEHGKTVKILPPEFYLKAASALGIQGKKLRECFPSTGFLSIWQHLQYRPENMQIKICGFGWKGWKRHPWAQEKQWVEEQIASGRIEKIG